MFHRFLFQPNGLSMKILSNLFKKKSKGFTLVLDENGPHYVGGKPNKNFTIPNLETSPVVYIGMIKKGEPTLDLLDFDLNLVCPIFLDLYSPIFLDYSIPNAPIVITSNVDTNFNQLFDDIQATDNIEYKQLNFKFDNPSSTNVKIGVHNIDMIPGEIGVSNKPNWIQDENWPNCPITGNAMTFLFQLGDIDNCKTVVGQNILDKEYIDPYLNFGHGYLYVFYEPESKVVAYLNQV